MLADRTSTYYAAYDASSTYDALKFEFDNGLCIHHAAITRHHTEAGAKVLRAESVPGAQFFAKGHGRSGKVVSSVAPSIKTTAK